MFLPYNCQRRFAACSVSVRAVVCFRSLAFGYQLPRTMRDVWRVAAAPVLCTGTAA